MSTIEDLEKRIKVLELAVKKLQETISLGGKQSSTVGSSSSELLLKSNGKIKLQWGRSFIDLIKDGKINTEANFIYKRDSVGTSDGIYVLPDNSIVLVISGDLILLSSTGNSYISFLLELKLTEDLSNMALRNIGFYYKSLSEVSNLKNGIVYIEDSHQLYIFINGERRELSIDIPNPITNPVVISKAGDAKGSLVIKGFGNNNGILLDSLNIYSKDANTAIMSVDNKDVVIVTPDYLRTPSLHTGEVKSIYDNFKIVTDSRNSWLYVNNVVCDHIKTNDIIEYIGLEAFEDEDFKKELKFYIVLSDKTEKDSGSDEEDTTIESIYFYDKKIY